MAGKLNMDPSPEKLNLMKELLFVARKGEFPSSTNEFRHHLTLRGWKNVGSIPEATLRSLHPMFQDQLTSPKKPSSSEPSPRRNPTSSSEDWLVPGFQKPPQVPTLSGNQINHHATSTKHVTPACHFVPRPKFTPKRNFNPSPASTPNASINFGFRPNISTQTLSSTKRKAADYTPVINNAKKSVDDFFCEICQANCSSALTLNQHLKGRPHKAKLKWKQEKRNFSEIPKCDLCRILCTDSRLLKMHFKGKKHQSRVQLVQVNGGENVISKPIRCELCQVNCMNEDLFKMHLIGKPHAIRGEMKRGGLI